MLSWPMKPRLISRALVLSVACSALILAGCSTIETRISENPEMFNRLSENDRALVQQAKIRDGMPQDAVYLAWGRPDGRTRGFVRGRPAETWIYNTTTSAPGGYGFGGLGYGGFGYGRHGGYGYLRRHHYGRHLYYGYGPFFDPFYYGRGSDIVSYPERTVSFQNGRVVAYQFLTPPRYY